MSPHKCVGVIGIDVRLFYCALKSLEARFVFVLEHNIIPAEPRLFKVTSNNRSCHNGPFTARNVAAKEDEPSEYKSDENVDDKAGHGCRKNSKEELEW